MAGILANSASQTMVGGDTTADKVVSGYVVGEQIRLGVTPAGTSYLWSQALPSGSAVARAGLDSDTIAAPVFTPDAPGVYLVTVIVDSVTTYVIRIGVTAVSVTIAVQGTHYLPVPDASIAVPALGGVLYYSSDQNAFVVKLANGDICPVELGAPV